LALNLRSDWTVDCMKWNEAASSFKTKFYEKKCIWIEFALPDKPRIFISSFQLTIEESSGEPNICFACQRILSFLWNPKFLRCVHKLYQINAICTLMPFKFKVHFNVLLYTRMLRPPKSFLPFRSNNKISVQYPSHLGFETVCFSEDKLWSFFCSFVTIFVLLLLGSKYFPQYPVLRPLKCAYILCLSWPSFRLIQKLIELC
jgi:hypothetical protein